MQSLFNKFLKSKREKEQMKLKSKSRNGKIGNKAKNNKTIQ